MTRIERAARLGAAAIGIMVIGGCSGAGGLGNVLGSVLGQGQGGGEAAGTVQGVDTRNQQITLQQSNGQAVALGYDQNTKVVFQNQLYAVTNLENGDQIVARVQQTQNGGYYTDSITVTQSVSGSGSSGATGGGTVQALQGVVRQIDRTNGLFTMEAGNGVVLTVSLPYNVSRADQQTFQNLRTGQNVRIYGVFLNNTRVELRQFY